MKKIILLIILIQQIALTQSENSVFPSVPYTEIHEIAVEGNFIYTAGDCNTGLVSVDAGQSWTTITLDETIQHISILPGSNGEKAIYQSREDIFVLDVNTLAFEKISSSSLFLSSGNYVSIEVDKEHVYVVSNQNVHRAVAGIFSWTKIADFNFDNDAVVATDITENYLHVGTLNGVLIRVNLATEASETMNDFMNRIYSFDMVSDELGYFTIQNFSRPIKTADGGLTYIDLENMPENIGVAGYGEDIIMTINTNRIYVSTDGGQSATYIPIPDDGTYDLIQTHEITEDGVLYLAGRSSMIVKSENFGSSFINLNEYKRENLRDIYVHSSGTGLAVGGYSSVVKTEDGGETWELKELDFFDNTNYLNATVVLSQKKYIVAGSDRLAIVENDEVAAIVERGLEALLYNEAGGYLIGIQSSNSDYTIIKSTDGGMTWESKAFLSGYSNSISQTPSGKIYIPGQDASLYTSTDGGDSWNIEEFGNGLEVTKIEFLDDNVGIASTGLKLYMTTDGGATANLISSGYIINNLQFISSDHIVYTTANEGQTNIYESTDGGNSFKEVKEFCSQTLKSFRDSDNVIWMAQNGGHINSFRPAGTSSTYNPDTKTMKVFPNPISRGQQITFDTEENISIVTLTSFDGKTMKTLTPVVYNTISTQGLNTGLYAISVQTINGEIKYGKLIIVD